MAIYIVLNFISLHSAVNNLYNLAVKKPQRDNKITQEVHGTLGN